MKKINIPNIISQRINDKEIYLKASNGKEFIITRNQINEHFVSEVGSISNKKINTINWIKYEIQKALGTEMIDISEINIDIDNVQNPIKLEIGNLGE